MKKNERKYVLRKIQKKLVVVGVIGTTLLGGVAVQADETSTSTTSPSDVIVEPSTPTTDPSDVVIDEPTTPTEPSTDPSDVIIDDQTNPSTDPTTPSTDDTGTDSGSSTETGDNTTTDPATPTTPDVDDAGGVNTDHTTVPTTDGGTATVTPDTSVPTNNPNISAETASNAGASQVGTTSTVTGQIVQDVTSASPVYTNTGATILSTLNGQLLLSTGEYVAPETVGATTNSDKTISVTTEDGTTITLPETGDKVSVGIIASLTGIFMLLASVFFKKQKRAK